MIRVLLATLLLALVASSPPPAAAAEAEPANPESLLLTPLPEVFTANRFKEQVNRAASAVTVITAEEIDLYGLTSLAELLRYVVGVNVAATTSSSAIVGLRGSTSDLSHKILVMVDGRSVYYDFYGHYWWQSLPVPIEEIRQVEIIRGPGASLYGANAFDGVIHILTKRPGELARATGVAGYSNRSTARSAAIASYADEHLGVKLSGELTELPAWRDRDETSGRAKRFNLYAERVVNGDGLLSFALGRSWLDNEFVSEFVPDRLDNGLRVDYLQTSAHLGDLTLQGFITAIELRDGSQFNQEFDPRAEPDFQRITADSTTYDVELNYDRDLGCHHLVGGTSFRRNEVRSNLFVDKEPSLDARRNEDLSALYLQDSFPIAEPVAVVAGLRFDRHPLTANHLSPRVALLVYPAAGHTLRLSYARAFRNPSFVESYIGNGNTSGFAVDERLAMKEPRLRPDLNEEPDAEGLTAWELGYRGSLGSRLSLNAELYYNLLAHLMEPRERLNEEGNTIILIRNFARGRAWGAEVEGEFAASRQVELFANTSYRRFAFDDQADPAAGWGPSSFLDDGAPRWLANLGVRVRAATGWFATTALHRTGSYRTFPLRIRGLAVDPRLAAAASLAEPQTVAAYTTVNGSVGYHTRHGITLTLAAANLLGNDHLEAAATNHRYATALAGTPLVPPPEGEAAEPIGRALTMQLRYDF
ncbi:MAG: TonB-dependent receptor [Deltaproteobacteria bacterium]|nr:TonB-dependent receptor [Deltaproteobacteria bacterium]PIU78766.1 MAG: hypothetical protein COS73_06355 [Nitrospirae bacterium CG06_land_8_20_14_3_00_70_43]PJB95372.1 MAG: hypothetical protein CO080_07990 [Nitrospirae bacterium CG_4_9_14_0_8_um_filter_70_14]